MFKTSNIYIVNYCWSHLIQNANFLHSLKVQEENVKMWKYVCN